MVVRFDLATEGVVNALDQLGTSHICLIQPRR